MNPLAYLYIKFRPGAMPGSTFLGPPRVGIALPIWLCALLGFGDLFIIDNASEFLFYINLALIYLVIYLVIFTLIPPKKVKKHYKSWLKKYERTTSLWAYLYIFSVAIIGFLIFELRHPI